jgi:molybdenum cofactor cytidylyltransferase
MGRPKQLLELGTVTLLRTACLAALGTGLRPVIVVLGAEAESCRKALEGLPVLPVVNEEWEEGLAGSLRAGLWALDREAPEASHVLVTLGDQPKVTAQALRRLVEAGLTSETGLTASHYAGTAGVPALFAREFFPELLALQGDTGARRILAAHPDRVRLVPMPEAATDLDTPDDYLAHLRERGEIGPSVNGC